MLNNKLKYVLLGLLIGIFLFTGILPAQQYIKIRITWDANTESDLAGYKVYNGTAPKVYSNIDNVGNVTLFEKEVNSQVKTYFAVTAYDQAGNESGYSDEVFYQPGIAVIDTVYQTDSYACVMLGSVSGFHWRVFGHINDKAFEITSIDSSTCLPVPVVDDWVTVNYTAEVTDLNGNIVYTGSGIFELPLTGDFNNDGKVALADLNFFAQCYRNPNNYKLAADYNRNGQNDLYDFLQFAYRYGRTK